MIGVFDSGVGGLSVLKALRAEMPWQDFVYLADSGNAPYGERGDAYVTGRTLAITRHLVDQHRLKALVIACNTATAAAVAAVRARWPELPVVGVEPALKPAAALSRTGRVGVMATRGTVSSQRFAALLATMPAAAKFTVQPCDGLALAIERGIGFADGNCAEISALCTRYLTAMGRFGTEKDCMDTLVLGCTHYPFAETLLRPLVGPQVSLIDTGAPVARQARRLVGDDGPEKGGNSGRVGLFTTGQAQALQAAAWQWLNLQASAQSLSIP